MEPPTEEDDHLRLHLFSLPSLRWSPDPTHHHEPAGARTPPLHTHASVPFLWEAEPGKPKEPCTTTTLALAELSDNPNPNPDPNPNPRALELPPRLLLLNEPVKFTKTPSPTTVLEGPYASLLGRSILETSSFRFLRSRRRGGSFDGALSGSGGSSPDRGLLGPVGLTSSGSCRKEQEDHRCSSKGLFGSWRKRAGGLSFRGSSKSSVVSGGSFVISCEDDGGGGAGVAKVGGRRKKRLLRWSSSSTTHFWANIYGAFKQIIPKTSTTKWKKDAL